MTTNGNRLCYFAYRLFIIVIIGSVFTSCKTSDNLADQGIIQKRKYQKGYHVNVKTPFKAKNQSANQIDINDQPFTASIKAEMKKASKDPELKYPKVENIDLNVLDKNLSAKTEAILQEPGLDENMEASISSTAILKTKSAFQNLTSVNESLKHSNTFSQEPDYYAPKRLNTLALLSFIFGVLSFFILGLPFGVAAVVCGIIGIVQIENKPELYKGKAFAIIGLIIGILAVIIMISYLSTL